MFVRLIILILAIASYLIKNAESLTFQLEPISIYICFITAALINLFYLIISYKIKNLSLFAHIQISIDIAITSVLVYLTGGLQSNFILFYIPSILAASIILGRRASMIYPTIIIFIISFHILAYKQGFFYNLHLNPKWLSGYVDNFPAVTASLLSQSTAFYLIAIFSSYLSRGLKEARFLGGEYAEITPDALMLYDNNGKIINCNSNFAKLCASNCDELQGQIMHNAPEPCPDLFDFFKNNNIKKSKIIELRHNKKLTSFEASAFSIHFLTETNRATLIKLNNLSTYQETQRLRERNQSLELVREMSASIAHEIRNPLAAMRGAAVEINSCLTSVKDKKLMNILLEELDRINKTVGNFMNMARMSPLNLASINLNQLIENSVMMLQQAPEADNKQIIVNLTENLKIKSDADHITQILINIGKNALQALPKNGIYTINGKILNKDFICLELCDDGIGIAPEIQQKIFTPFFSTKSTGSGLGLPMVAQLIESLGGTINLSSKPGHTKFTIILPKERNI